MIPILHSPGVIAPGQFGPMSVVAERSSTDATLSMSCTGVPSVIAMTSPSSASSASSIASIAPDAGTKMIDAFAPVSDSARDTVSKIGKPSRVVPPAPGTTPADDLRAVLAHPRRVEGALASHALNEDASCRDREGRSLVHRRGRTPLQPPSFRLPAARPLAPRRPSWPSTRASRLRAACGPPRPRCPTTG